MKKTHACFLILLVVFFIAGVADARLYKWVDDNGVVHFSDKPPTHGKKSGKVEAVSGYGKDGKPKVSFADYGSETSRALSNTTSNTNQGSTQYTVPRKNSHSSGQTQTRKAPKVELYSTSWCGYCKLAAKFFRSKGIHFTEYDIDKDKSAARRKKQLDKGGNGVPFVMINGKGIHGYSTAAYEKALK